MAIRDMKAWDSCGMSHIKVEPFMETVVWWLSLLATRGEVGGV